MVNKGKKLFKNMYQQLFGCRYQIINNKKKYNKKHNKKQYNIYKISCFGFTLVEMLVAVSVFSILFLVVTNIFIMSLKAQKNIILKQKIANDASHIIELLAEKIRTGSIYYQHNFYKNGIDSPTELLVIKDKDEKIIMFRRSNQFCFDDNSVPCFQISFNQGHSWHNVTSAGIKVLSLNFYIDPPFSPFLNKNIQYQRQPRVTVSMVLGNGNLNKDYKNQMSVQTSITTRTYKQN